MFSDGVNSEVDPVRSRWITMAAPEVEPEGWSQGDPVGKSPRWIGRAILEEDLW